MKTFLHMNAGDVGREQSCVADHSVAVGKKIMYSLCMYQFTLKLCVFFARDREYCTKDTRHRLNLLPLKSRQQNSNVLGLQWLNIDLIFWHAKYDAV